MKAIVVGGGIIGTWHAFELVEAGFAVDQLEAEAGPVGASVRNFGLVWVSGRRSGEELEAARRARRRWEEVGSAVAGLGFRANGSLTVATDATERQVMLDFASLRDAGERAITFLEPGEVRTVNPAVRGEEVTGALHCADDGAGRTAAGGRRAAGRPRTSGAGPLHVPPPAPGGLAGTACGGGRARDALGG